MVTRGFTGRQQSPDIAKRLPPGQSLTGDFPVLSAGPTPHIRTEDWSFTLKVGPKPVSRWNWAEFNALPPTKQTRDIHCVTKWSKLDTPWQGVLIDDILAAAGLDAPPTPFTLAHSFDGYSTNVPTADLVGGKAMVALRYESAPLPPDHGGPARLLVPHLYFWKSAKWVSELQFIERDEAGFWELRGYHIYGDPWREQRLPVTDTPAGSDSERGLRWQQAAIAAIVPQTPRVKSFFLELSRPSFRAGQHVDVRLAAPDGYRAERSYSIASAPEARSALELAIERLDDGEVSPFFHDVAAVGDDIELRGPIGGYFVWEVADGGPILLIGGGSGVVPLMSMIRDRASHDSRVPMLLLFSARTFDDVLFRDELLALAARGDGFELSLALTRRPAQRARDYGRRVDTAMVSELLARLPDTPEQVFVCGSNPFVEAAADSTIAAGIAPGLIRTERYGG